jgi:putative nucleotidyltransferase with HDIG domain
MTTSTTKSTLDRIISTVGDLPASPAIVSTVMGLTSNPDSKIVDVTRVLSADQSLTAKILKLSNSSFYGRPKEVQSLQEAILLLGFSTLRSIVIATSAHLLYTRGVMDGPGGKLWRHSLASAIAARQVAQHVGHKNQEEIFIAALLHDIGKLVLLQKLPDRYNEVIQRAERGEGSFFEVEASLLGFNHCEVASILLDQWHFPATLCEAVFHHHSEPTANGDGAISVSGVVQLGNLMAKDLGVGFNDRGSENLAAEPSARLLSLDQAQLAHLLEEAEEYYRVETGILEESCAA